MKRCIIILNGFVMVLFSCHTEKENKEITRVEKEASKMRILFRCAEVNVNSSVIYSPKGTFNRISLRLLVCDSLNEKSKIDSLKENQIKNLGKKAFNQVTDKTQFKFYCIAIYKDYEQLEHIKAYNFIYDFIKKKFDYYSGDLIPVP